MKAVREARCGTASTFRNLTQVPLLIEFGREADYIVLDEGIARGWVEIRESTEAGRVPELNVINRGNVAVLLLDGEELLGAKQNRVLNLTILVPPERTVEIPVSCVEAGRWHLTSTAFVAASRAQFADGRAAKMRQVTDSLVATGGRRSVQAEVWRSIADKSARLETTSETAAMSAMYEKLDRPLDAFVAAFPPMQGQVGAVFLREGRFAGLELFDAPGTWRKLAPKLVRSYALDAIDDQSMPAPAFSAEIPDFIGAVLSSNASVFPAIGEGEDVRLTGTTTGAALVARGRAIHVSAFPGHRGAA
jgi:hypothetical protein